MASLCRSAAVATARSVMARSKSVLPKPLPLRRSAPLVSRSICTAVGTVESLMPLHSAIASARLKSFIAMDSSCWSWLSQVGDVNMPAFGDSLATFMEQATGARNYDDVNVCI